MAAVQDQSGRLSQGSSQNLWPPLASPPGAFPLSPRSAIQTPQQYYETVGEVVNARKDQFLARKTIKVKVGTWNTASLHGTEKDLGGWFARGLGVKGLAQDLPGLRSGEEESDHTDSDLEPVEEQEAHFRKKSSTLPKNDTPGIASGDEVDLYVLGLQEIVDIASMTEAIKPYTDLSPSKKWKKAVRRALPPGYKKVVEQQLMGLLLLVFASPQLKDHITSIDSTSVGTGLMGYMGNKGAVSARIVLGEATRLTFVNCHLAAGTDQTALARRIWDTNQILLRTKFAPVGDECMTGLRQPELIGDEDYCFWFGDLNYRLDDVPGEDVRRLLLLHTRNEYDVLNESKRKIDSELGYVEPPSQGSDTPITHYEESEVERPATASSAEPPLDPIHDPASLMTTLKSLLQHDQLKAQQRAGKVFHEGWREGEINFLPTYKYDVGSVAMFDSGEKKRSPSWCDRILFRSRRDYERYKMRAKMDVDAQKWAKDMHKRGLEAAVQQENVLFDYDPARDGTGEDEQNYYHESNDSADHLAALESENDDIKVEEYISHQRVLSSDHKPLSALFSLSYDSVDQALKAKVQQEVTREFDKAENEAQPSVTLVLDHAFQAHTNADKFPESFDSNLVDFGDVCFDLLCDRQITIANTGPMDVVFAMISRPSDGTQDNTVESTPEWLSIHVDHEPDTTRVGPPDLANFSRYRLQPGETATIRLSVHIQDGILVQKLNNATIHLDDILVLRVSGGRDFFVPVRATWLQTCFYRSVDELTRIPSGARKLTIQEGNAVIQQQPPTTIQHSAPPEIFALTDILSSLVTRYIADWAMLHPDDAAPPWQRNPTWPFDMFPKHDHDDPLNMNRAHLINIREALDLATDLETSLCEIPTTIERLELICAVLLSFLASLTDGIINAAAWQQIESKLHALEKSKTGATTEEIQDIVQEALSNTPAHSVSLTFVTFTLMHIIDELGAASLPQPTAPATNLPQPARPQSDSHSRSRSRSRSSTTTSAMSEISLASTDTVSSSSATLPSTPKPQAQTQTKSSWLSALSRRATTAQSTPITLLAPPQSSSGAVISRVEIENEMRKKDRRRAYAEIFAPVVIRSHHDADARMKVKEKKVLDGRKKRVLEGLLEPPTQVR